MNNWKRWGRGALAVAAMGGAVLASSGCVSLDDVQAAQNEVVGGITITETVCMSGSPGCANVDNLDGPSSGATASVQLLVGYRVPAAVVAPATVTADSASVTFAASPTYAAELERLSPAGAGRRWVGYIGSTVALTGASDPNLILTSSWGLPQGADGAPFTGPVGYRPVLGFRLIDATHPDTAPVACDPASLGTPFNSTLCVDSPLLATLAEPDLTRTTRDLGILTGATATGPSGTTVTVPFTARYAGAANSSANFALNAATTVPGATVTVTPGSLLPAADSTNPVSVAVAVPAGTAPGTYDVTLTARLNAQTRVRTGTITVTAPPPPVVALKLSGSLPGRLAFLTARGKGVKVVVRSNRSGRAVVRLVQAGKALTAKTVTLRNGATTVVLRSRKVVAGGYRVTVTFTATGKVTTLRGTLRAK